MFIVALFVYCMHMIVLLLFGELLFLYLLAARLTQAIYDLTMLLTRSRAVAVTVVTLLAFPGTVIHELSHLFTAEVLGVRTGKLTLVPESIREEEVKTGSVMIAATDPFRRYTIGLAPVFAGLMAITALSYLLSLSTTYDLLSIFYFYLLFAVSNSMFSSREDLKGFIPFILTLTILIAAAYIAGIRVGLTGPILAFVIKILDALTKSLGVVLALNIIGLLLVNALIAATARLTHRTLHRT